MTDSIVTRSSAGDSGGFIAMYGTDNTLHISNCELSLVESGANGGVFYLMGTSTNDVEIVG